ncbi:putative nitrogen fixation related protein [Crocosphaera subtropica ATCC 51142]|uniref:Nitrogen fixation related protein n=1 Tax=Crocosphaera subtropica (strain ATCC 51142 / BH68) TaxID=43989 RepID=B1WT63_CROS5|nr:NifB/NifX family molybdenum-iron cluster-binding protein [Crocosphaera subtropica]ACB51985.1 putative nitrogen fixation related protein [Crocosphaera subtropica ATCC 51142]
MKFALVSDDFQTITGKTGRARKFLVYEATQEVEPTLLEKLEVPETQPTFHDLHDDDITPHPLDQSILITGEAGVGLKERLSRRGITVYITSETDPLTAIQGVMKGNIVTLEPTPHKEDGSCMNH